MKPKVLFIMHMPPPVHGAAMIGQYIHDSKLINDNFNCIYFNPSASNSINSIGKFSFKKGIFFIHSLFKIYSLVRKEKPDLCYITPSAWDFGFYRDWFTVMLLKCMRCNIIVHFHNKGNESFEKKWYNKLLYKIFFKNIKVIFIAENLVQEFDNFIKEKNIYICPNGIRISEIKPINRISYNKTYTFLFLSNIIETKGVYILLEACSILKAKGYVFKCNFIGEWGDITKDMFYSMLDKLDIRDYINVLGPKYGEYKKEFFISADAFVFPSYYETFGLVLLEAMEYELPCIGTDEGGIPTIINNNYTGFIIHKKDVDDLVEKMMWLIDNPEKGILMGKRGYNKLTNDFSLSVFERRMLNILKNSIIK